MINVKEIYPSPEGDVVEIKPLAICVIDCGKDRDLNHRIDDILVCPTTSFTFEKCGRWVNGVSEEEEIDCVRSSN